MGVAAWKYFTTQKQWELYLKDLLKSDDVALQRAIVLIYDRQTEEEKQLQQSVDDNYIGFTKWDAKELGGIAIKIKNGQQLTKGELAKSRNKMGKYWKQLMAISKQQQVVREAREQQELEDKLREEEQAASKEEREAVERFHQYNETLRRCAEEGIACAYGICDECPVTQGIQLRMFPK